MRSATIPPCFFLNDTATTEIYTLSLHDALPISSPVTARATSSVAPRGRDSPGCTAATRSEEHTSELQSPVQLVCSLLLEKKNAYSVWTWKRASFGILDPVRTLRIIIPAITALIIGVQIVFSSFFLSVLGLR